MKTKDSTAVPPGWLQLLPVPESRFSSWSIDFTTDLPLSHRCNTILTCVDCLKKYTILIFCRMEDIILIVAEIAKLIFLYIVRYVGVP